MFSVRNLIWATIATELAAYVVLFSAAPIELRAIAALLILAYVPGFLLVRWLDYGPFRSWLPMVTATVAMGFAIQNWVTLFALYAPGALSRTVMLFVFGALTIVLLILVAWSDRRLQKDGTITRPATSPKRPPNGAWRIASIVAALLLLGLAAYFRFADLGSAQFQGDEATAIVYAASVAQGHEDVIFQHRRGPVDILVPAGVMLLTGDVNETALRLPFAVAALAAVAAVYLLGSLLFGGLAGWLAAFLAAVDGYLIGFGRVMHYESVVVLAAALGIYTLYQFLEYQKVHGPRTPADARRALLLAALFLATGMAAHYDGAAALIPAAFLLWRLWRTGLKGRPFIRAIWPALAVATVLLLAFYIPYLTNPFFQETLAFYTGTLADAQDTALTGGATVNHLAALAESLLLYNGGLKTLLMLGAPACGLILLFWRQPRRRFRALAIFAALMLLALVVTAYLPAPGLQPWIPFIFAILTVGAIAAPQQTDAERILWLWFLLPFFVAIFVVKQPGLHFYFFITPWLLLTGWLLSRSYHWLQAQWRKPVALSLGIGILALTILFFSIHAWRFFIAPTELAQQYQHNFAPPRWWPTDRYDNTQLLYGIPHREGWKTVGALYATGELTGSYSTNIDRWAVDWYTRGAEYCRERPDQMVIELATRSEQAAAMLTDAGDEYALWGIVEVDGRPALHIYRKGDDAPQVFDAGNDERKFDETLSSADNLALTPRVVLPLEPAQVLFGDTLALTGYALQNPGENGENLALTVAWSALERPEHNYYVQIDVVDASGVVIGERLTELSCQAGPSSGWKSGKQAEGYYRIPMPRQRMTGEYALQIRVVDGDGAPLGNTMPLTTFTIK